MPTTLCIIEDNNGQSSLNNLAFEILKIAVIHNHHQLLSSITVTIRKWLIKGGARDWIA